MNGILLATAFVMMSILMKKDAELPWVARITRWAVVAFGIAYCALELIEKAKAMFM